MLIHRAHTAIVRLDTLLVPPFYGSPTPFDLRHGFDVSLPPSLPLSISPCLFLFSPERRISSAVRNLQILFQLHPGKRSLPPVPAGKTASATLKTRPIAQLRSWPCKLLPPRRLVKGVPRPEKKGEAKTRDGERKRERERIAS